MVCKILIYVKSITLSYSIAVLKLQPMDWIWPMDRAILGGGGANWGDGPGPRALGCPMTLGGVAVETALPLPA